MPDRSRFARFAVDVDGALVRTLHLTLDDALIVEAALDISLCSAFS